MHVRLSRPTQRKQQLPSIGLLDSDTRTARIGVVAELIDELTLASLDKCPEIFSTQPSVMIADIIGEGTTCGVSPHGLQAWWSDRDHGRLAWFYLDI